MRSTSPTRRLAAALVGVLLHAGCGPLHAGGGADAGGGGGERSCTAPAGPSLLELVAAGRTYATVVHQPDTGAPRRPAVIDLHGLDADARAQAAQSAFPSLGAAEGFITAEPTGQLGPLGVRGWEIEALDEAGRDDIAFIDTLITELVQRHCADPQRIYVAGYSNGGFLAAELRCRLDRRVAAVAAVAGFNHPDTCDAERPVPLIVFHGTADPVVPFEAGGASLLVDEDTPDGLRRLLSASIADEVARSAGQASCAGEPTTTHTADFNRVEYSGCDGDADHVLYVLPGAGHTWPGSAVSEDPVLGPTAEVEATRLVWAFFADYRAPGTPGAAEPVDDAEPR